MADKTVIVTGTPPNGHYDPPPPYVMNPGTTTIDFVRGSGQSWAFQSPYASFNPPAPFAVSGSDGQVTIADRDVGGVTEVYECTLYTTEGTFDPEIINKG